MIEIFKKSDFKIMPWKNGGGVTTELFRMPTLDDESFLFRLSQANVTTNGPFSIFPNIDRTLILIDGHGLYISGHKKKIELNKKLIPVDFKGEEVLVCDLIRGPCIDFNIMTDRNFANSAISVIHPELGGPVNFKSEYDLKFIYDIGNETLYKLEKNDLQILNTHIGFPLILIDIKLL